MGQESLQYVDLSVQRRPFSSASDILILQQTIYRREIRRREAAGQTCERTDHEMIAGHIEQTDEMTYLSQNDRWSDTLVSR